MVTGQRLAQVHRRHLGTDQGQGDAGPEVSLRQGKVPRASPAFLASQLLGGFTAIEEATSRVALQLKLQEILEAMEPLDREILALRHFEELNNDEAALAMGIAGGTASRHYVNALGRLSDALARYPDSFGTWCGSR